MDNQTLARLITNAQQKLARQQAAVAATKAQLELYEEELGRRTAAFSTSKTTK